MNNFKCMDCYREKYYSDEELNDFIGNYKYISKGKYCSSIAMYCEKCGNIMVADFKKQEELKMKEKTTRLKTMINDYCNHITHNDAYDSNYSEQEKQDKIIDFIKNIKEK